MNGPLTLLINARSYRRFLACFILITTLIKSLFRQIRLLFFNSFIFEWTLGVWIVWRQKKKARRPTQILITSVTRDRSIDNLCDCSREARDLQSNVNQMRVLCDVMGIPSVPNPPPLAASYPTRDGHRRDGSGETKLKTRLAGYYRQFRNQSRDYRVIMQLSLQIVKL